MTVIPYTKYNKVRNPMDPNTSELYRHYKRVFDDLSDATYQQGGSYNKEFYITVDVKAEFALSEFIDANNDGLQPVIGLKGIGKTHLIRYLFCDRWGINNIEIDNPKIYMNKQGTYDILLYLSFTQEFSEHTQITGYEHEKFITSRVKAMSLRINDDFGITVDKKDLEAYIKEKQLTVLTAPEDTSEDKISKNYSIALLELSFLLGKCMNIENVYIIYDDLESLDINVQDGLIRGLAALNEELKNLRNTGSTLYERDYYRNPLKIKSIFSMRYSTLYNLRSMSDSKFWKMNDNQALKEQIELENPPKLDVLFRKRFEIWHKYYAESSEVSVTEWWEDGHSVLNQVLNEAGLKLDEILFKYANESVVDAISEFMRIIKNKRYTEGRAVPNPVYTIKKFNYNLHEDSIWRVLFRKETEIYRNDAFSSPFPFVKGGNAEYDLYTFLILKLLDKSYKTSDGNFYASRVEKKRIREILTSFVNKEKIKSINDAIDEIFEYLREKNYIRRNDLLSAFDEDEDKRNDQYYIRARGDLIYNKLKDSTLLFDIFRDSFELDENYYNTECSVWLNQLELFKQYLLYVAKMFEFESKFLYGITVDNHLHELFQNEFGEEFISNDLIKALESSLNRYKNSHSVMEAEEEDKYQESIQDIENEIIRIKDSTDKIRNAFYKLNSNII